MCPSLSLRALRARQPAPLGRHVLRYSVLAMSLLAVVPVPQPVWAQSTATDTVALDIPAGPLDAALAAYVHQSGVNLSYDPALLAGHRSPGVQGRHTSTEALGRLLADAPLRAVSRQGGYMLQAAPPGPGVQTLAPVQVQALAPAEQTEGSGSYVSRYVSLGKGQTVRELPQSVSVITHQRIEDQNLQTLSEVMAQTPGVTVTYGANGGAASAFHARGFEISKVQVDGSAVDAYSANYYAPNLTMYDSVQVVRGADGLFSGTGEPGGAINLVRKRPQSTPRLHVEGSVGRWQQRRAEVDATGPLNASGSVRGRAVIAHEARNFYYDAADASKSLFYGILETDIGTDSTLAIGASYERERSHPWGAGLPRTATGDDLGLPRNTSLMAPWNTHAMNSREVFAQLDLALAGDWRLKAQASHIRLNSDSLIGNVFPSYANAAPGATPWLLDAYGFVHDSTKKNVDVNLSGSFAAWGQRHHLLVGADWSDVKHTEGFARVELDGPILGQDDLSHFDRDSLPSPSNVWLYTAWPDYGARQKGLYGRLRMHVTEQLAIVAGGRYASFDYGSPSKQYDRNGTLTGEGWSGYRESGIFTPYGGVVYDINNQWTAYASVAEIHKSQTNRMRGPLPGQALKPITGRSYEVGVKGDLAEGRYTTSAALYRIERKGQAVRDPAYPSSNLGSGINCCWLDDGDIISQGLEAEITGELLPGWQVAASYTFNSNEDRATQRRSHSVTPRHQVRLWSTYRLRGDASAWTVGGGVNLQSRSYVSGTAYAYDPAQGSFSGAQIPFDFTQGGYAVWNLMAQYRITPQWTAAFNVNNLFDKTYYKNLGSIGSNNWYGEPRNVVLSLRGTF